MGKAFKNPPVYFTLAQVRFNTVLKLADYLPAIQDGLRLTGYPGFAMYTNVVLQVALQNGQPTPVPTPMEQAMFSNADQTASFIVRPDALTFQTSRYGTYEKFSEEFLRGLSLVHSVVNLDFTDRVGLRYLDHVFPKPGDNLVDYLVPEASGLRGRLGGKASHSYTESLHEVNGVQLLARVVVLEGEVGFPPDLMPQGMVIDPRFLEGRGLHAMLDTDGSISGREPFSLSTVEQQLSNIHVVVGEAFKATITDHARNAWNQ